MRNTTRAVVAGLLCGLVLIGTGRGAVAAGAASPGAAQRIDLNTASATELAKLPGVGPAKAQAIVEYRSQEPFASTEDLRKVKGIGDKLYDRVKGQVTVGDPAPARKDRGS